MNKKSKIPSYINLLRVMLHLDLYDLGINSTIDIESILNTKLFRFKIISKEFKNMYFYERQDMIWRMAREISLPESLRHISMISTLTENE